MPLTHKRLTIDGNYVDKPMNVRVPIGTSIDYVLDFAGVDKSKADKILMGGPMMGIAIYDVETPVIKNNNAILVLQEKDRKYKASRTVSTLSPAVTDGTDNPEDAAKGPGQHGSGQGTCPPHHRLYPLRKMRLCLPGEPDAGGAEKAYDKKERGLAAESEGEPLHQLRVLLLYLPRPPQFSPEKPACQGNAAENEKIIWMDSSLRRVTAETNQ